MRKHTCALLLLASVTIGCQPGPDRAGRPPGAGAVLRLALLQYSYWGGGFDRPLFLAYSDGTMLFPRHRLHGIPDEYGTVRLSPSDVDTLLASWGVDRTLYGLDSLYDFAPGVTDQHSFYLLLPQDSAVKLIVIRAGLRDSAQLRMEVPSPFKRLYANLLAFAPPATVRWLPDSLEVSIWPYEYAPDNPPLAWPIGWPGLADSRWQRHPDQFVEEVRTIRFPFSYSAVLDSLLSTRRERQAIGISNKKWAMGYRWLFPHEEAWWWLADHLET